MVYLENACPILKEGKDEVVYRLKKDGLNFSCWFLIVGLGFHRWLCFIIINYLKEEHILSVSSSSAVIRAGLRYMGTLRRLSSDTSNKYCQNTVEQFFVKKMLESIKEKRGKNCWWQYYIVLRNSTPNSKLQTCIFHLVEH